jgi:hypothetical protein
MSVPEPRETHSDAASIPEGDGDPTAQQDMERRGELPEPTIFASDHSPAAVIREEPCGDGQPHEAHVFSYGPMSYQCPGEPDSLAAWVSNPLPKCAACGAAITSVHICVSPLPGRIHLTPWGTWEWRPW